MLEGINLPIILIAGLFAAASPGPATLAIAGTAMAGGRKFGLALALGICTGSLTWSITAAFGFGALMSTNVWVLEVFRYIGAAYLMFLGIKSAHSALKHSRSAPLKMQHKTLKQAFLKGLLLHLTNPKAVLFFGSLYAIAVPPGASRHALLILIAAMLSISVTIFLGYALLFSSAPMVRAYMRLRKWFEAAFAAAFITAGIKIFVFKLQ